MHLTYLKQQNNVIYQIRSTKNFQQDVSSGSLSFHPVWGNKKVITKKSASRILHSGWLWARALWAEGT